MRASPGRLRAAVIIALGALAFGVAAVLAWPASDAATGIRLVRVASGLDDALDVVAPPGDPRLFVVGQGGQIRIVKSGRVLPRPFLDVSRLISAGGERGLLGLAFHPDYARNGRFYVDYTNRHGDTRVVEYRVSRNPDRANPRPVRVILRVAQPFPNHNGGDLVFGPDGKLYVGMGDGGSGGDPLGNGQRLDTLLGKILRLDVDHGSRIAPSDNPFVGRAGARPEIFAYGLRNPWRFSFDRGTGALWIGDVGQSQWEEIDRLAPGRARGANLGWNAFEGRHPFSGRSAANGRVIGPVAEYDHGKGISVTGGFVYRGTRVPALRGRYVYGDYGSGRVWTLGAGPRPGSPREITGSLGVGLAGLTSFGQGTDGELYVIGNGTLYRFARR